MDGIKERLRAVSTTMTIADKITPFDTVALASSLRPAPYFWLVSTVNPVAIPLAIPSTRNMIVPVEPTAARAPSPTNFPTIIVSTIL